MPRSHFQWQFHVSGYAWRETRPRHLLEGIDEPTVLVLQPVDATSPIKSYHPLTPTAPALRDFLSLADAEQTKLLDAIRQFANRYGDLGAVNSLMGSDVPADSFRDWWTEITEMSKAYDRSQSLSKNPPRWWPSLVRLSPANRKRRGFFVSNASVERPTRRERQLIAHELSKQVSEKLTANTAVSFTAITKHRQYELAYVPKNLLGAMWLDFAKRLAGDEQAATLCVRCEKRLDLVLPSGRRRRKDARFCGDNCRSSYFEEAARKK